LVEENAKSIKSVLSLLARQEYIVSNMPYLVGIEGDAIRLLFKRLLFSYSDRYSLDVRATENHREVTIRLNGEKSSIVITFSAKGGRLTYSASYKGPRRLLVKGLVNKMAKKLLEKAVRDSESMALDETSASGVDYSRSLSSLAWVTRLLQKSMLVHQGVISVPLGGLVHQVEAIISGKELLKKYSLIYVSGTSNSGSFRLLFENGRLAGVYANIDGREYYGNERVLGSIAGVINIRIYGSLTGLQEAARQ